MGNAMNLGVEVLGYTPDPTKYKNDNIHPCVRYIDGGFAGHDWWMVTTPYFNSNTDIENPILYYGDSEVDGTPPLSWQGGVVVEDTPTTGYNSDGCIYFDGTSLWVFWRANNTPETVGLNNRAIIGCKTIDGVNFTDRKVFTGNTFSVSGKTGDNTLCPIVTNFDGDIKVYATNYEFSPKRKPYGFSFWNVTSNDLINNNFSNDGTSGILYNENFNFWHFDIFKENNIYYCVCSPELGDEILLGKSSDGINFEFYSKPLLSNEVAGTDYLYKPSVVIKNEVFYLFHPNKIDGRSRIFMSQILFSELLEDLDKSISKII